MFSAESEHFVFLLVSGTCIVRIRPKHEGKSESVIVKIAPRPLAAQPSPLPPVSDFFRLFRRGLSPPEISGFPVFRAGMPASAEAIWRNPAPMIAHDGAEVRSGNHHMRTTTCAPYAHTPAHEVALGKPSIDGVGLGFSPWEHASGSGLVPTPCRSPQGVHD